MDGMSDHGGHQYGMGGMSMPMTPSPSSSTSPPPQPHHRRRMTMMMHMTFYWGSDALVLFDGWPGRSSPGMYALSLAFVFFLCFLVEWLTRCRLVRPGTNDVVSGIVRTGMHAVRTGVAYMAMLAVMSFNAGIFIAAVAGHAAGFMVFGTRVFMKKGNADHGDKNSDLQPPMTC